MPDAAFIGPLSVSEAKQTHVLKVPAESQLDSGTISEIIHFEGYLEGYSAGKAWFSFDVLESRHHIQDEEWYIFMIVGNDYAIVEGHGKMFGSGRKLYVGDFTGVHCKFKEHYQIHRDFLSFRMAMVDRKGNRVRPVQPFQHDKWSCAFHPSAAVVAGGSKETCIIMQCFLEYFGVMRSEKRYWPYTGEETQEDYADKGLTLHPYGRWRHPSTIAWLKESGFENAPEEIRDELSAMVDKKQTGGARWQPKKVDNESHMADSTGDTADNKAKWRPKQVPHNSKAADSTGDSATANTDSIVTPTVTLQPADRKSDEPRQKVSQERRPPAPPPPKRDVRDPPTSSQSTAPDVRDDPTRMLKIARTPDLETLGTIGVRAKLIEQAKARMAVKLLSDKGAPLLAAAATSSGADSSTRPTDTPAVLEIDTPDAQAPGDPPDHSMAEISDSKRMAEDPPNAESTSKRQALLVALSKAQQKANASAAELAKHLGEVQDITKMLQKLEDAGRK